MAASISSKLNYKMDTQQIQKDLDKILDLSAKKVEESIEGKIGEIEKTSKDEVVESGTDPDELPESSNKNQLWQSKSATTIKSMTRHYVEVMRIVDDEDVPVPEAITNPSERVMVTSLAAEVSYQQQPNEDSQFNEQNSIGTIPIIPENDQNHASDEELNLPLKTKLKEIAFGFPPAVDVKEFKEKLKLLNEAKIEKMKKLDEAAKKKHEMPKGSSDKKNQQEGVSDDEKEDQKNVEITTKDDNFDSSKGEGSIMSDEDKEEQQIAFQNRHREPVAFSMLPEENFTGSVENVSPDMKFFFGSAENKTSVAAKVPQKEIEGDDQSQSVSELVEHVQEVAEEILVETEKILKSFELYDDKCEKAFRNDLQLKETPFQIDLEDELEENQDILPEPMVEVLEDPAEVLNKKLFEATQDEETFDPPTLSKLKENTGFEYSPMTGTLKFEKRPSMQPEDLETIFDLEKSQHPKQKLRRSEGSENLSVITEETKQLPVKQHSLSKANVVDKKTQESKSSLPFVSGAIKKVHLDAPNKPPRGLTSVATISSLLQPEQQATFVKLYNEQKKHKGDDDDGYINLPNVPSTQLSEVMSSAWIDKNETFAIDEKPSVHTRALLGRAGDEVIEKFAPKTIDEPVEVTSDLPKTKNLRKWRGFFKRIFRKNKD